jgi:hypothetical protein
MKKFFAFFSNAKLAIVALAVIQVDGWVRVNPLNKKLERMALSASRLSLDVTATGDSLRVERLAVLDYARTDTVNKQIIWELQTLVKTSSASAASDMARMAQAAKSKELYIKKLESGVRVDLVRLRYRNAVFGPDKLVDSVYVMGFRWGTSTLRGPFDYTQGTPQRTDQ